MSYMRNIPNMVLASPADEDELQHLLYSAVCCHQPFAIRYPRGGGQGITLANEFQKLSIGKGEIVREGQDLTILAIGPTIYSAIEAAEMLAGEGTDCAVINSRFAKPLDSDLILDQSEKTRNILTVEENSLYGGFGSAVLESLSHSSFSGVKIKCLGLPDKFVEHGPPELFRSLFNIDSEGIAQSIRSAFPELLDKSHLRIQENN